VRRGKREQKMTRRKKEKIKWEEGREGGREGGGGRERERERESKKERERIGGETGKGTAREGGGGSYQFVRSGSCAEFLMAPTARNKTEHSRTGQNVNGTEEISVEREEERGGGKLAIKFDRLVCQHKM
jgi:hypothetical protein